MFGTLTDNPHNFSISTIGQNCLKVTDGKHGGCSSQENSGYYFIGAREIYDEKVHYQKAPQITKSDFEKDYKRCNCEQGDFVIVNTGATIGKSAILQDERTTKTLLQKSVALIKPNKNLLNAVFIKFWFNTNPQIYKVENSSAQPNLLLSQINKTKIIVPPIELQNQFADFVKHIDKLKFTLKQTLEKLENCYHSLMQEYFE